MSVLFVFTSVTKSEPEGINDVSPSAVFIAAMSSSFVLILNLSPLVSSAPIAVFMSVMSPSMVPISSIMVPLNPLASPIVLFMLLMSLAFVFIASTMSEEPEGRVDVSPISVLIVPTPDSRVLTRSRSPFT